MFAVSLLPDIVVPFQGYGVMPWWSNSGAKRRLPKINGRTAKDLFSFGSPAIFFQLKIQLLSVPASRRVWLFGKF